MKRRLTTGLLISLALVSSGRALSHDEIRGPVVRFIDFYVASQKANAPKMSLWERIIYGLALAKASDSKPSCHAAS